ncbi:hypothetical protein MMC26_000985, partial [Xylographa opegraphella]|nr:hypothetical protein [Xylographa opegraphella]
MDGSHTSSLRPKSLGQGDQHNIAPESAPPAPKTHHHKRKRPAVPATLLPFQAVHLSKHDYSSQRPIFALYLEVQKQLALGDLSENEARGRWKSFVGKWNRGELAEGWYDPVILRKAIDSYTRPSSPNRHPGDYTSYPENTNQKQATLDGSGSSDDENIGPALPENQGKSFNKLHRSGPTIPSLQDLELRR